VHALPPPPTGSHVLTWVTRETSVPVESESRHLVVALTGAVIASFWLLSWTQGNPDAYANQHARGLTLALAIMLISLASSVGKGHRCGTWLLPSP